MQGQKIDRTFLWLLGGILLFGVVMLSSASGPAAFRDLGDPYGYVKHQLLFGFLPGLIAFYVLSRMDYRRIRDASPYLLAIAVLLLLMVFIPGIGEVRRGVRSWIGFAGISAQPVELVKLLLLAHLAALFERRGTAGVADPATGLVPFLMTVGLIAVLLMLQPDLGSLLVIGAIAFAVYFAAGAPLLHLAGIIGVSAAAIAALIFSTPYRWERVLAMYDPSRDAQNTGWHLTQAWAAIASGGWFGLGLGHSKQKLGALPETIGDSVFAIMAEELGYVVMLLVLLAFAWLTLRMLRIARRAPDQFGKLVVVGIAAWFFAQTFLNISSVIGLTPLTGLPLPFVSYGGTSLVALLAAMGVVANISRHGDDALARRRG